MLNLSTKYLPTKSKTRVWWTFDRFNQLCFKWRLPCPSNFNMLLDVQLAKRQKPWQLPIFLQMDYQICNFITNVLKLTCLLHSNFANELEPLPHLAYEHGIKKFQRFQTPIYLLFALALICEVVLCRKHQALIGNSIEAK